MSASTSTAREPALAGLPFGPASTEGTHSKIGLAGSEPKDTGTGGDWMVQAILTKPQSPRRGRSTFSASSVAT